MSKFSKLLRKVAPVLSIAAPFAGPLAPIVRTLGAAGAASTAARAQTTFAPGPVPQFFPTASSLMPALSVTKPGGAMPVAAALPVVRVAGWIASASKLGGWIARNARGIVTGLRNKAQVVMKRPQLLFLLRNGVNIAGIAAAGGWLVSEVAEFLSVPGKRRRRGGISTRDMRATLRTARRLSRLNDQLREACSVAGVMRRRSTRRAKAC